MATVPGFTPAHFFALRTPLLPFARLLAWSEGLTLPAANPETLPQALAADRARLRAFLRDQLAHPVINEAIFVASPDLHTGLTHWLADPTSEKGLRAERSLVRYFARMAGRATPFGLFSGCSLGMIPDKKIGRQGDKETLAPSVAEGRREGEGRDDSAIRNSHSTFTLAPQSCYQRHTRLDMDYLFALCETLGRDPAIRSGLSYFPNSSLYRLAGQYRYAEARLNGKVRDYHLVVIEANDYLDATLHQAARGATPSTLAAALVADDPEINIDEAEGYIHELIDSQVLVSQLTPAVTGREPIHGLIDTLEQAKPEIARSLQTANQALSALDKAGLGAEPAVYLAIAEQLRRLPTPVELGRLFQVDMVKPMQAARVSGAVLAEMQRGIALLQRITPTPGEDALSRFRERFVARYEGRQMPLLEVLDEEMGIGFRTEQGSDHAPLLGGLHFPAAPSQPSTPWGQRQQWLLRKVAAAWQRGSTQIELSEPEIDLLANPTPRPLPNSFALMTTVAARSPAALAEGDFTILLDGVNGPSGAKLLGRFCHGDPALQAQVEAYLAAEANADPAALYAEIVHLPEGRIGNVLCRPVLRHYEILYLGQSGADPECQIPVSDLLVSVVKGEIQLHSQRLGRRVIPRLTTAHNFVLRGQGVYMFLCSLQSQGVMPGLRWEWGALESADFLPRISHKRLVLARARWRMNKDEIVQLGKLKDAELFRSVQEWRKRRHLPRFVVLTDADNELPVDLDNILSIESFIDTIKNRSEAILHELFPGPDELCASGPEGAFVHELVVPFLRTVDQETRREGDKETGRQGDRETRRQGDSSLRTPHSALHTPHSALRTPHSALRTPHSALPIPHSPCRSFPPGSEWLYAKLYTGAATADRVLTEVIAPVVRQAVATGAATQWFFIRYGDPDWHLRVRMQGDPARLLGEVLPHLHAAAAPWLADRRIWKLQLDTYEQEVERYGGAAAMALAERLFHTDSEAVLAIVERLEGDAGAEARWRLTYAGLDMLLDDLGFDLAAKQRLMRRARDSFQHEFRADSNLRSQLGEKHRTVRADLAQLLDPSQNEQHPFAPGIVLFQQRSAALHPIVTALRTVEAAGHLNAPLAEIAWSYLHMHANRLLRSAQRSQELVLYELLDRHYSSQQARQHPLTNSFAQ
jgi:thiopeptide-type bacteriocin biosynthesis protein